MCLRVKVWQAIRGNDTAVFASKGFEPSKDCPLESIPRLVSREAADFTHALKRVAASRHHDCRARWPHTSSEP